MNSLNSVIKLVRSTILLFLVLASIVSLNTSCKIKTDLSKKLNSEYSINNIVSKKITSTTITKEDLYTYKIPKTLDFTKELTSNFEKDRPQVQKVDSLMNDLGTYYLEYDSFVTEAGITQPNQTNIWKGGIDYTGLSLKKVTEFSELEKLTIYSAKGLDVFEDRVVKYPSRIDEMMNYCIGYYKETGTLPDSLWDFGFFRDAVNFDLGVDWKSGFDELFTNEPGSAFFISPIIGEFFSFNNPTYKKGQIYIQKLDDPNLIKNSGLDAGEGSKSLIMNQNCWFLYYRVYGEDENTIIKEDVKSLIDESVYQ